MSTPALAAFIVCQAIVCLTSVGLGWLLRGHLHDARTRLRLEAAYLAHRHDPPEVLP